MNLEVAQIGLFCVGSAGILYLSWASLRSPGSHGFYRFFAWECILGLFALNVAVWIRNPFSPCQLVSWTLLCISAYLILEAVYRFRRYGRLDESRGDESLVGIEKTTQLVTNGVYRYIRHPMYSSLLFLAWGIMLKDPTWLTGGLAGVATLSLFATAKADEQESTRYFGASYEEYMKHTKRFVPFLF